MGFEFFIGGFWITMCLLMGLKFRERKMVLTPEKRDMRAGAKPQFYGSKDEAGMIWKVLGIRARTAVPATS